MYISFMVCVAQYGIAFTFEFNYIIKMAFFLPFLLELFRLLSNSMRETLLNWDDTLPFDIIIYLWTDRIDIEAGGTGAATMMKKRKKKFIPKNEISLIDSIND